jgi:hypothetical protein
MVRLVPMFAALRQSASGPLPPNACIAVCLQLAKADMRSRRNDAGALRAAISGPYARLLASSGGRGPGICGWRARGTRHPSRARAHELNGYGLSLLPSPKRIGRSTTTPLCGYAGGCASSIRSGDAGAGKDFGFKGDIFIAETGSIPTGTGASSLNGFKVARIDRNSGMVSDFITHPCGVPPVLAPCISPATPTQAVVFAAGGFNKPIDVRFHGSDMFIVDFGIFAPGPNTPNSGKIWKVTNTGQ